MADDTSMTQDPQPEDPGVAIDDTVPFQRDVFSEGPSYD